MKKKTENIAIREAVKEIMNEDFVRNWLVNLFKTIRDKKTAVVINDLEEKEPELAKTLTTLRKLSDQGWEQVRDAYKKRGYDV